jgi:hypothetical protein
LDDFCLGEPDSSGDPAVDHHGVADGEG